MFVVDDDGERCLYIDPGVNDEIKIGEINPLNIVIVREGLSQFILR